MDLSVNKFVWKVFFPRVRLHPPVSKIRLCLFFRFNMNSLNFCGTSSGAVYPIHSVNSMLFDLHHQMAEQYHVYSAASPTVHTLSVAERLAGRSSWSCTDTDTSSE